MLKIQETGYSIDHMIRLFNTNVDGRLQLIPALKTIRGVGLRFATAVIKIAKLNPKIRGGELSEEQKEQLTEIIANPMKYDIPSWFLNNRRDTKTGKDLHLIGNEIDTKLRFAIETGKKLNRTRWVRLNAGLKVRGQHTGSNGRGKSTLGVLLRKK